MVCITQMSRGIARRYVSERISHEKLITAVSDLHLDLCQLSFFWQILPHESQRKMLYKQSLWDDVIICSTRSYSFGRHISEQLLMKLLDKCNIFSGLLDILQLGTVAGVSMLSKLGFEEVGLHLSQIMGHMSM